MLEIKGSRVTTDAPLENEEAGCQVKIAETIVDQQADYVLAVKGNLTDSARWRDLSLRSSPE